MKFRALVLSMLLTSLAFAADVTGKWAASMPGRNGQTRDVTYNFTVDGDKLTGTTTGFQGQDLAISDGKVKGDNISFTTKVEFNGNAFVMKYKGKVSDDEIKFTMEREGGDQPAREFTAKRVK